MTVVIALMLTGILFTVSHSYKRHEKELYFSGETVAVCEVKNFFTDIMVLTEDASNPGDSEHTIHLYNFPTSCDSIPIRHTYEEYSFPSTSELPTTITYLVKGSSINVSICALSNTTTERTELLLFNDLSSAKSPSTDSTAHIDFEFFTTGADGIWECFHYSYETQTTSFYVLSFLHPDHADHDILYNYTLKIDKLVIDLGSNAFTSNCSLRHDEDHCSFAFDPTSSQSSCIVASIERGDVDNRRFVHGILDLYSRQGDTIAGIVASFIAIILVLVLYGLFLLGVRFCVKY